VGGTTGRVKYTDRAFTGIRATGQFRDIWGPMTAATIFGAQTQRAGGVLSIGGVPLDVGLAERLLRDQVRKKIGMFEAFPEITEDDLLSETMLEVIQAWPGYTPAKGQPSTFICTVGIRHLLNVLRGRSRDEERRKHVVAQVTQWTDSQEQDRLPDGLPGGNAEDVTIEDRIGAVYRYAVKAFPTPKRKGGPNGYGTPSLVACAYLMQLYSLSTRAAEMMVEENADLREAMGLKAVPSHWWFVRAGSYLPEFERARKRLEGGGGE